MQLGIFTFLRRSPRRFPPIAPPATSGITEPPGVIADVLAEARPAPDDDRLLATPRPFYSGYYGYRLTLPPHWQAEEPRTIAGSPPIDGFRCPGDVSVGIWNETCPLRVLAKVPPADRIGTFALADGAVVPFTAFAPSPGGGTQFLEGRWLAGGKRWTVHVQAPANGERAAMLDDLGGMLASLSIDG
ncbi:MAG: hypothetical protein ACR2JY_18865 [Chloroflexota bacterium]